MQNNNEFLKIAFFQNFYFSYRFMVSKLIKLIKILKNLYMIKNPYLKSIWIVYYQFYKFFFYEYFNLSQ